AVAVPLPVVLRLLAAHPLRRWRVGAGRGSVSGPWPVWREKLPFAALMLVFIGLAIRAKAHYETVHSVAQAGLSSRLAQACYGICFYAVKTVAPIELTAYY